MRYSSSLGPGSALGEKGKKIGLSEKKKFDERSEPRGSLGVVWGGETVKGGALSPSPSHCWARFARPIFFVFDPVFCLFPPLPSLVQGYIVRTLRFIHATATRTSKKAIGNLISKTTALHEHHTFLNIFLPFCTITT